MSGVAGALPDWLDADLLEGLSVGMIFVGAVGALIVLVWVRSLAARLVLAVLLGAGAFGAFVYREDLVDCAAECDCRLFGDDLHVDACANLPRGPAED